MTTTKDDQPILNNDEANNQPGLICSLDKQMALRAGSLCPRCHQGIIDYDGLLQLVCPHCGIIDAGACT